MCRMHIYNHNTSIRTGTLVSSAMALCSAYLVLSETPGFSKHVWIAFIGILLVQVVLVVVCFLIKSSVRIVVLCQLQIFCSLAFVLKKLLLVFYYR